MTWLWVLLIAACILLAGYYAGTETGFYRLNRVRLRYRARQGQPAAKKLETLIRRPDEFVVTALVANNVFVFLATFTCTRLYAPLYGTRAEFLATLTLIGPIFLFGEVLQKEMYRAACMLRWSMTVFAPVVFVLKRVQGFWTIFMRSKTRTQELLMERRRLYHFFHESAEEGTLSAYQRTMAANIMKLQGLTVERVMIPRQAAVSVALDASHETFRHLVEESPYRRLPVADASGALVGVVNVLDVLSHKGGPFRLADCVRRPAVFGRDANVIDAFHVLNRSRQPMGFVTDAEGASLGIITIKDLVEEIVGELRAW